MTLSRLSLVGGQDEFTTYYCHGLQLAIDQAVPTSGLTIRGSSFETMSYGLFQTNVSTAVTTGVTVADCVFMRGTNTDLEFNSPLGRMGSVVVERCAFVDNTSEGFGVGLAFVVGAVVRDNTFTSYAMEAVHGEDYARDVTVSGNVFTACGLRTHAHVQLISGVGPVRITDNLFRADKNTVPISVVNALPGGSGPTPGGRPTASPSGVEVVGNRFVLSSAVRAVYFSGVVDGLVANNQVTGAEGAAAPTPDRVLVAEGGRTAVRGNEVAGIRY